jgi:hypothetical protein
MGQRIDEFKRRFNLLKSKWENRKPQKIIFNDTIAAQHMKETRETLNELKEEQFLVLVDASYGAKEARKYPELNEISKSLKSFEVN